MLQNLILLMLFGILPVKSPTVKVDVALQMKLAQEEYRLMVMEHSLTNEAPYSSTPLGKLKDVKPVNWVSGFFAGNLWYLYDYSRDKSWKNAADKWTRYVQSEQFDTSTHDLGFILYCSYGNGYRLTKNPYYKKVLLHGAASLATRFNRKIGAIKSWDNFKGYNYPVIIDNMMNLELLMWANKESGNKIYSEIAISHADKTLHNQFRPDNSSYHVIAYAPDGRVMAKITAQGLADNSAWARGQAWGLYGFTMMFRETGYKRYLEQALKIADFYLHNKNLPADKIPYWDFNAPGQERDASAGAITSSALFELADYADKARSKEYFNNAVLMLQSLSSPAYQTNHGNNNFLLKHSVANKPARNEINAPLIYAD